MPTIPAVSALPDLFTLHDGHKVLTADDWRRRRAELLEMIQDIEYGHLPPKPEKITIHALNAFAPFQEHGLKGINGMHYRLVAEPYGVSMTVKVISPSGPGPFPVVIDGDACWQYLSDDIILTALRRGYALAIFNRVELVPDDKTTQHDTGLHSIFPDGDFGALAGWAWGYHRVVDLLQQLPYIDATRIAVTGHSRGGKTALLAGATDERIALTVPNNSGCGGAGCYRFVDEGGERLEDILRQFAFWFSPRLAEYLHREDELPFDQHSLKALVAPRALLCTEALGDHWASPRGTRLTHDATRDVYRFLNAEHRIGIWYREGGHAQRLPDWEVLLDFADVQFYGKPATRNYDLNPWL